MKLYLVQHAQSQPKEEDPARPLTDEGVETVRRMAEFLARTQAISVSEIRHSTKLRARQTAEQLAGGMGLDVPIRQVPNLEPLDEVTELARALDSEPDDLMLVGHLPHLNKLASRLVCGDEAAEVFAFQQGGVLCLGRKEEAGAVWRWTVEWMVMPKLVAGQ